MRYLDVFYVDFVYFVTLWHWKIFVCLQALRDELEQHKVRTVTDHAPGVPHVFRLTRFIIVDFYS